MSTINFSPFTSIFENKAAGTIITGKPGSGKTFFILNLIANSLLMNQKIFALDPKDDLGVISDIFPQVEYININDVKPGALNPFSVLKHVDTNFIISLISIICGNLTDEQLISITPIVDDFIKKQRNSSLTLNFTDIVNYLYANDNKDAQSIGTKLLISKNSKYGSLLLADELHDGIELSSESKIISFLGMDLPDPNAKQLTEVQKFNSGIIYIICNMLKELLISEKYPTLFVMDEAHIAMKNASFAATIDEFLVLGRSLNIATILATQNASHFPEEIPQLIASKFCFLSSTSEAQKFLDMFLSKSVDSSEDIESIVYQISTFNKSGQCFFIDSNNRTGIFRVTSLLSNDISSNPLTKKKKKKGE